MKKFCKSYFTVKLLMKYQSYLSKFRVFIIFFVGGICLNSCGGGGNKINRLYSDAALKLAQQSQFPVVSMQTSLGEIVIELDNINTPITVANFLNYVEGSFYDGSVFHRVLSNFVIQAGGYGYTNGAFFPKATNPNIVLEAPYTSRLSNIAYSIAMARGNDPNSGSSQFFINLVDNSSSLNGTDARTGYAVFGRVILGANTVQAIAAVPTKSSSFLRGEVSEPASPPVINSVVRVK